MKKDVKNIMHSSFDKTNKPLYICPPLQIVAHLYLSR